MNDAGNARQQIVDKIKQSSNILVTVGLNPSVDELSAALGLTLMLNKLKKHATAVVSGDIPPAITFLDPEKTFEGTVDSLRDFIIALDKEKADHLRYKVDGDVVKIFITPYRTTITNEDLDFSQGDYNVELVLALGVKDSEHLDKALEAHGRILHDATVATISVGAETSNLGSIDWKDESASSLSEMLVSLSEAIKGDKALLDEQIATALLTGIVAATDRFSNTATSSKVMTMAAQLMAAGANQQLIAAKLEDAHEIAPEAADEHVDQANSDGTTTLSEGEPTKVDKEASKKADTLVEAKTDNAAGTLAISHEPTGTLDEVAEQVAQRNTDESRKLTEGMLSSAAERVVVDHASDAADEAEKRLEQELAATIPTPPPLEPSMGGTLNATTEQAADDRRREDEDDRNKTILSHDSHRVSPSSSASEKPRYQSPFNSSSADSDEPPTIDPFIETAVPSISSSEMPASPADIKEVSNEPTLAELDTQNRAPHDEARAEIDAVFGQSATSTAGPASPPQIQNGMPPLPDFTTLPPPPQMPDFSQPVTEQPSGAVPPEKLADIFSTPTPTAVPDATQSDDPGQFKIPGN